MKSFKLNLQILIIFWALIAFADSTLQKHIGSDGREYLIEDNARYNWFQARRECAHRNRQLLQIDSSEKQDIINTVLEGANTGFLWLGANDELNDSDNTNRRFYWSETGKEFTYANWNANNPYKIDGNRHCVLIWFVNKKWFNYKCDDKNGFICEEKQLPESFNKNPSNASEVVQKFINDLNDLKFLSILRDNMAQLNGELENIRQVSKDTNYEIEKLTYVIQTAVEEILNKQELSTKELNHEITKQASDLSGQMKRSVDELNANVINEKQNVIYHPKNIVLIKNTG